MTLNTDISTALHLLEHVSKRVEDCDDPKLQLHTSQDLQSLISLLEDPVFRSIVTIQDSLEELNSQLGQHPSILPGDFDINLGGQLELSVPTTPVQPVGQAMYQNLYQDSSEVEDQRVPVAPLLHSSSEETNAPVTSPNLVSEVIGMPPIMTPTYAKEFQKVIETAAKGRQIVTVQLFKSEGMSLGFSVVGLRNKERDELGIFLQEIQPNGIAGSDGRLLEGDQILAIDGQPLDSNISHEQAISILQKARGLVELIVARSAQDIGSSLAPDELSGVSTGAAAALHAGSSTATAVSSAATAIGGQQVSAAGSATAQAIVSGAEKQESVAKTSVVASGTAPATTNAPKATQAVERSNSAVSDTSKSGEMVLQTEYSQVEIINLVNDGSGLGFGIVGGKSTGVVVKTILPGGVADRDNRLQSGDHMLQIGDVNLRGMASEQVAQVLRQSGTHVRLVVARPVEPITPEYVQFRLHGQVYGTNVPIVPTKVISDPEELDRHLMQLGAETTAIRRQEYDGNNVFSTESEIETALTPVRSSVIMDSARTTAAAGGTARAIENLPAISMDTSIDVNALPEMERFTVELQKDSCGLGITIAGYVCEKEELSGIFVKSISEGSAADLSKKIQINDRIVEVNGHSLQGYSNHEAVEVLRSTKQTVLLCLERYLRGPKYEQLQQAIAASELRAPPPGSPSIASLPSFPISADGETTEIEPEGESHTTVDSAILQEIDKDAAAEKSDDIAKLEAQLTKPSSELTPNIEEAIKSKWTKIVGDGIEIVVAQLKKFTEESGLGISLEGTVDVENGREVRPHHYIRSILPEGPVGKNGVLRSGDELLEVNGYRLLGINHMEVVAVLKKLPIHVRMVCGRSASQDQLCPIDTGSCQAAFQTRSILGGSLQNLLPTSDRLVKAKSDGSLASTTTTATVTDASLNKMKSRSLEPLTGLAMWSSEPQIIELVKGERGLGFSILDYQDPMNPNETVIVIRSLVPGGVAQVDGQLIPGDRLLFVNDIALENATLDQAVQALKGAPKGVVRIGVAKPLPIPDSIAQRLATMCMVKRSKSLPDSDATEHAAEIDDFIATREGGTATTTTSSVDQLTTVATAATSSQVAAAAAKDKRREPHSSLIKLVPFSERERRALVSRAPAQQQWHRKEEAEEEDNGEAAEETPLLLMPRRASSGAAAAVVRTPEEARSQGLLLEAAVREALKRRMSTPDARQQQQQQQQHDVRRRSLRHMESMERVARYLEHPPNAAEASVRASESIPQAFESRLVGSAAAAAAPEEVSPEDDVEDEASETTPLVEQREPIYLIVEKPDEQATKRRSSLRRRREDPAESVVKDSQDEYVVVPIEATKKTVRICSVEEEIRIESFDSADMQDPFPGATELKEVSPVGQLPELQLVTAKILSQEEAATTVMAKREDAKKAAPREQDKLREERAADSSDRLQAPGATTAPSTSTATSATAATTLKPSASETALTLRSEDNKVSEKNIKPEILMDLSRVNEEADDGPRPLDREFADAKPKRKLSRVSSDSACRITSHEQPLPRVKFHIGEESEQTLLLAAPRSDRVFDAGLDFRYLGDVVGVTDENIPSSDDKLPKARQDVSKSLAAVDTGIQSSTSESSTPASTALLATATVDQQQQRQLGPSDSDKVASASSEYNDRACAESVCLISREHSLRYQRQTLESPASLEDLLATTASSPVPVEELDAATLDYSSTQSLLSTSLKSIGSPKREVETQTQGEQKSTQYELEDLAEYVGDAWDRSRSDSREQLECLLDAHFGSPRREADTQTELESKASQCVDEDLAASGEFGPFRRRQASCGSPRKEAQVQTGQEHKSTQCYLLRNFKEGRALDVAGRVIECSASSVESSSPTGSGSSPPRPPKGAEASPPSPPLIVLVKSGGTVDMTVTHRDKDGNVVWAKHWGPERLVEIYRDHQTSLGLSIVGGKVDLQDSSSHGQNVSGIFIKNVIPNSPAGRTGGLQTGDRIIEVDGVDLRNSTHERAVKAIQAAGNPVRLLVQSLVHLSPDNEDGSRGGGGARGQRASPSSSIRRRHSPSNRSPELIQDGRSKGSEGPSDGAGPSGRRSSMKKSIRKRAPSPPATGGKQYSQDDDEPKAKTSASGGATPAPASDKKKYSSGESSEEEEEDTRDLEGNVYTKSGVEISRRSAGNVKRTKEEIAADPEQEDEFGYTKKKIQKKYANLKKPIHFVVLEKDRRGLGISLAGHKDRNKMAVFICGINPNGVAAKQGELQVGDELLEVNGAVFQGRCHLNASSMIKGMGVTTYKIIVIRRNNAIENCAVKQVTQFPTALAGEDYSHLKGVHPVPIKKGTYGLGIMIIEGKHAEVGQGIFVSDIQVGSAAELAGLNVGDMILSVNADTVMGATYDEATALLKKAEGIVVLTVCNPNQSKVAEEEERRARGEVVESGKDDKKKDEKPKDEPPGDPKDCKIRMNKDTTIEFPKDKDKPIGFYVVGGTDTPSNGVFVLDVLPDGAAGKDGRLQPGDRIVDINKEPFKAMDSEKAYQTVLRITQGPIIMIVHRDEKAVEEFEVELTKKSGKGSGLCLTGYKSGKGAYVSEVVAGGSAAESGKIVKGDRIVAVGGQDLRDAPVEDIALHVKVSNPVQLKLARYKSK
uniref:Multiple PDZ domain protein n=1 Tax=Trichogramma kaykai TaxID=54128 RepID=A0ABD2X0H4_9HYME